MKTKKFIKEQIIKIKKQVGSKRAIVACSGGVDSTTCVILAHKALGRNLLTVFIDNGSMREDEPKQVVRLLKKFGIKTRLIRNQRQFFQSLRGKIDPEEKRKAFREAFYQVLGKMAKKEKAKYLIQGTIKADIDETVGGVKTQHNVLEQISINPKRYGFEIIEPLRTLYKPEVREVARNLGLPKEIFERMPFPGPGLATRIVGEITPQKVKIVRLATKIIENELLKFRPFQAFPVLLSDRATGIKREKRVLGDILVIRCVESEDALKAEPSQIPWEILMRIQERLTMEIPTVVRALYDLTPKPLATIEYI